MPEFTIACTSRTTGKPYTIHISAPNAAEAENRAATEGHIITPGSATPIPTPITPATPIPSRSRLPSLLCLIAAILLLLAGCWLLASAAAAPITPPTSTTINMGLLADRQLHATFGLALLIPGSGLLLCAAILRR